MRQQILTISLCCVFILSALSDVLSQPLHRTDLSNLRVNAFAQDSLGYIWIATANGLCKSFGESYDVFFYDEADEHSIPSNLITGHIWSRYRQSRQLVAHQWGRADKARPLVEPDFQNRRRTGRCCKLYGQ